MNRPRPTTRAFTLTELLVVMGIILITIVVGLPSLKALFTAGRVDSAAESISGTVAAARAFATRDKGFLIGEYSGVAVIFTPANELRLVENVEDAAKNNGDKLEELNPSQSGYENIDRPYLECAVEVKYDGEDYLVMDETDILGVIK